MMVSFKRREWLNRLDNLYNPARHQMQASIIRLEGFISDLFYYNYRNPDADLPQLLAEHFRNQVDMFAWYSLDKGLLYEFDRVTEEAKDTQLSAVMPQSPLMNPRDPGAAIRMVQAEHQERVGRRGGGKHVNNPYEAIRTIDALLRGRRDRRIVVLFLDAIWDFPGRQPENQELVPLVRSWPTQCLGSHLVIFAASSLPRWTREHLIGAGVHDLVVEGPTADELKQRLVYESLLKDQQFFDWEILDSLAQYFEEYFKHPDTGYRVFKVQNIDHRGDVVYDVNFLKRVRGESVVFDYNQIDVEAFEYYLNEHLIGQAEAKSWAIQKVSALQRRGVPRTRKKPLPLIRKLFAGPSGVGKTEIARIISRFVFDRPPLILPFADYSEEHQVAQLVGAPPGYVGYGQPTLISEYLQEKPYGLIVLDEFEKGHPKVRQPFMNVLDEGVMTIPGVARLNFGNTIIIATSNTGSREIDENPDLANISPEERKRLYQRAIQRSYDAALLGRLDGFIIFDRLTDADRLAIAQHYVAQYVKTAQSDGGLPDLKVNVTEDFYNELLARCPQTMGARKIENALKDVMENVQAFYETSPETRHGVITLDWSGEYPTADGQVIEVHL